MGPYRHASAPRPVEIVDLRGQSRWWTGLLIAPFLVSLVLKCRTVVFADEACKPTRPNVTLADGLLVAELRCPPKRPKPPPGYQHVGGFCGTYDAMQDMALSHLPDQEPVVNRDVDLTLVRMLLAGLAALGAWLTFGTIGDRGARVVIDRQNRLLHVRTPQTEWTIAFGDRPTLVERDQLFYLHASKTEPIVVATSRTSKAALARLREALRSLDVVLA